MHQKNCALCHDNLTNTKGRMYLEYEVLGMRCVHYVENICLLLCATRTVSSPWRKNCDAERGGRQAGQHVSRSNSKGSINFRFRLSIYHQSGPSSGMIRDNIWRKTELNHIIWLLSDCHKNIKGRIFLDMEHINTVCNIVWNSGHLPDPDETVVSGYP